MLTLFNKSKLCSRSWQFLGKQADVIIFIYKDLSGVILSLKRRKKETKIMFHYSLIISIVFLGLVFSGAQTEEPEEDVLDNEDSTITTFFDYWIPRMRMRGRHFSWITNFICSATSARARRFDWSSFDHPKNIFNVAFSLISTLKISKLLKNPSPFTLAIIWHFYCSIV